MTLARKTITHVAEAILIDQHLTERITDPVDAFSINTVLASYILDECTDIVDVLLPVFTGIQLPAALVGFKTLGL